MTTRRWTRWMATLGTALAAAGCDGDAPVEIIERTAAEHGAALFRDPSLAGVSLTSYACATCHATSPEDAGAVLPGAPLAGVVARPSYWGGQEIELLRSVNHCLYYFMLKDAPWTAEDPEARAIYAYLESLPEGPSGAAPAPFTVVFAVSDPPPGDAGRGETVYRAACASCHGALHSGAGRLVERAAILPEEWLEEHPADEYTPLERRLVFVEKVRHGGFLGYGGQMPPFSLETLSDQDLGDLLAFLGVP